MSKEQHQLMETILVQWLRLSWIAATLPILIALIPIPQFNLLRQILLLFAKRGKIMHPSSSSQKFTVPQRFFLHFYVVASIWTMFLLVATWVYAYRMVPLVVEPLSYPTLTSYLTGGLTIRIGSADLQHGYVAWQCVFLLLLMEAHVLRRLLETIYVFNYSPSARMHIVGYFTGLFFYIAAPLSLCGDCALEVLDYLAKLVSEFIVRGKNQMPVPEIDFWLVLNPLTRLGWKHWVAAAVFLWGWIHQYRCHKIFGSLRDSRQADEYVIPHGDWFEIVSSPHYLAEIVIYASFVVATGGSNLTIWLLFVFVVANLAFAAVETHSWYRRKFEDYPNRRFTEVAELVSVCWFEIRGWINTSMLSPHTLYGAYLVFKATGSGTYGFEYQPVEASIVIAGGDHVERNVFLDVERGRSLRYQIVPQRFRTGIFSRAPFVEAPVAPTESVEDMQKYPKDRADGWLEMELGEFFNEGGDDKVMEIGVYEVKGGGWKGGLVVQGIEIRPKPKSC